MNNRNTVSRRVRTHASHIDEARLEAEKHLQTTLGGLAHDDRPYDAAEIKRAEHFLRRRSRQAVARSRASEPTPLRLEEMSILLAAAIKLGGPLGALIELCILTLRRVPEIVGLDLADIDWRTGYVRLRYSKVLRGSEYYLSEQARASLRRIAGSVATQGQAIIAGRGRTLQTKQIRIDRLRSRLALVEPATIPVDWRFAELRNSGCSILLNSQASREGLRGMLGQPSTIQSTYGRSGGPGSAVEVAEQWAGMVSTQTVRGSPASD